MLGRDYPDQVCSISRALEVIGQRWTLLIIRDVFLGHRRFDELWSRTAITRSVLAARLANLVEEGVLDRHCYQTGPARFEYRLSDKGYALLPVIAQLMMWGDRYYGEADGPPLLLEHRECGGRPHDHLHCDRCDATLTTSNIAPRATAEPFGFSESDPAGFSAGRTGKKPS